MFLQRRTAGYQLSIYREAASYQTIRCYNPDEHDPNHLVFCKVQLFSKQVFKYIALLQYSTL